MKAATSFALYTKARPVSKEFKIAIAAKWLSMANDLVFLPLKSTAFFNSVTIEKRFMGSKPI